MSRSASQTASAVSSVQPPRKTASRRKSRRSSSSRRSCDQAIVARRVECRSSASRVPLSRSRRASSRSSSASGERSFVRAAASSTASGRWSRRAQSSVTCSSRERSGRTACARSMNSALASASASGGRSSSDSPWMRNGSRLVVSSLNPGAAAVSSPSARAAVGQQMLEVVADDMRASFADRGQRPPSTSADPAPSRSAIVESTRSGSRSGASAQKTVPPSASSARSRASSRAKRVFPVPPGPRIVSARGSRSYTSETASNSSRSRPRKRVVGVGRSTLPGVRTGGKAPDPSW